MSEKLYKIGEAAQMLNLKSYVLRFWESEFPQLRPTRTESGQRLYTAQNLELLQRIRHLLHERGLTIEGARKILSDAQYTPDDGLSSDLLDEGYTDFIADLNSGDDSYSPSRDSSQKPAQVPLSSPAPTKNELIADVLAELKSIRALFPEARENNSR